MIQKIKEIMSKIFSEIEEIEADLEGIAKNIDFKLEGSDLILFERCFDLIPLKVIGRPRHAYKKVLYVRKLC